MINLRCNCVSRQFSARPSRVCSVAVHSSEDYQAGGWSNVLDEFCLIKPRSSEHLTAFLLLHPTLLCTISRCLDKPRTVIYYA
jgi:hypothetical protein